MGFDTNIRYLPAYYSLSPEEQAGFNQQLAIDLQGREQPRLGSEWGRFEGVNLTEEEMEKRVNLLLSAMTLEQKVNQMTPNLTPRESKWFYKRYNDTPYTAGEDYELNIPGIRFTDGPAGIVMGYHSTAFPSAIARGATFDSDLEYRIGSVMGIEGRTLGANLFGGVCINLIRHPAWGRGQESYGEDPFLLGEMGKGIVQGIQNHMMACVKHFALNSMENARFTVNVQIDERSLHEVYLPHFKKCIDAGAAAVMSAYNKVLGQWCGHNSYLLRDILKEKWGFNGFVISDFIWGVRDTVEAANGGLDIEMHIKQFYGEYLVQAVKSGLVAPETIREAAQRILRQKLRFSQVGDRSLYQMDKLACKEHRELAREAAEKSIVLLKNDHLLPLDVNKLKKIVVVGRLAKESNLGDVKGSAAVYPPDVVTPLEGICNLVESKAQVVYITGECPGETFHHCKDADAVIAVVGLTCKDEGEYLYKDGVVGGDRTNLGLHNDDVAMIQTIAKANSNCIVCMEGGSAIITHPWDDAVKALLMLWYPGMEGGHALARILFGKVNPSGKLPITIPKSPQQLPYFAVDTHHITYDFYHGYFLADEQGYDVSYPFGYGLSYTSYQYSDVKAQHEGGTVKVSFNVTNTGGCSGDEIAQVYIGYLNSKVPRHVKDLKGFKRVHLNAGQTKRVTISIAENELMYYDVGVHAFVWEDIVYLAYVGSSSRQSDLQHVSFTI